MQRYVLNANGPERSQVLANLHAFVDRLPAAKSWRVEIKEYRKERTSDQLGALFGLAYAVIMDAAGLEGDAEKKQLHRDFCGDFFGWTTDKIGRRRPVRTTTTNENGERDVIDTATQARMYDFIQRQMAEFGIDVPAPDPMHSQRERFAA